MASGVLQNKFGSSPRGNTFLWIAASVKHFNSVLRAVEGERRTKVAVP